MNTTSILSSLTTCWKLILNFIHTYETNFLLKWFRFLLLLKKLILNLTKISTMSGYSCWETTSYGISLLTCWGSSEQLNTLSLLLIICTSRYTNDIDEYIDDEIFLHSIPEWYFIGSWRNWCKCCCVNIVDWKCQKQS